MADDNDLASRLGSFTFSTPEEKLLNQLASARITPIFQRPPPQQAQAPANTSEWESPRRQAETEDGWGELPPSYTAVPHNSMFGFNSIIEPQEIVQTTGGGEKKSLDPKSGFARFQNNPVSFTDAKKD